MPSSRMRDLRTQRNWSQEKLAREADISRITVLNIEMGRSLPNMSTARKLAKALGVSVDDLFEEAS